MCSILLLALLPAALSLPILKVLPLGDSITFGCGSDAAPPDWYACCTPTSGGYRAPLWAALNGSSLNASIQMVGTMSNGPAWLPASQRAHEGHAGWTISMIKGLQRKWTAAQPDVVLLLAGTNDIGQGHTEAAIVSDYAALLAALRATLPSARLLVATVLSFYDSTKPELPAAVAALNSALPALVAAVNGTTLVDLNAETGLCRQASDPLAPSLCAVCNGPCGGYNPAACPPQGYGYCHPTGAGYSLVGGAWAAALLPVLHELAAARQG